MATSLRSGPRASAAILFIAVVASSCSDGGLRDDADTVAVLREIGAVSEDDLRQVKLHGNGHIKGLDLMGKDISRVLPHLGGLKQITGLKISVRDYSALEIRSLGKLSTLTHLTIACQDEHFPVLQSLVNVKELEIIGEEIEDSSLRYLASMKGLQNLSLEGVPISGTGFSHLKDFTDLQELNVAGTRLSDDGITAIVDNFPRLKKMEFSDTDVSREGALRLAALPWLYLLNFPKEVVGPDAQTVEKSERSRHRKERQIAKDAFAKEFRARHMEARRQARDRGEEVPSDDVYPLFTN